MRVQEFQKLTQLIKTFTQIPGGKDKVSDLCESCEMSDVGLKHKTRQNEQDLIDIEDNYTIWAKCMVCQKGDKEMVDNCASNDCDNYYLRLVTQTKLKNHIKK